MRSEAFDRLKSLGIPTRKSEDWHYYPTAKFSSCGELARILSAERPAQIPEEKRPDGNFGIESESDFSALLPIAFGAAPFVKEIPEGASENGILKARDEFSHTVFRIGKGAKVSLEILENKNSRELSAERLDFFVGEGASLELFSTEEAHEGELLFRTIRIHQAKDSNVDILDLSRTGALRRLDIEAWLEGENANFGFRALNLVSGSAHENGFVRIHHIAPDCKSRQFVRNLIAGKAIVSYDGEVIVGENCHGTDSSELINTMLLSDDAKIQVKPVLKIYHDDVSCSHGNTVGSLDQASLFYLESRGISPERAEKLLIRAFAQDILAEHPEGSGRGRMQKVLGSALETLA